VVETGKAIVVLFDDSGVDEFVAIRIGSGFRHGPAGLGQLGALQDKHGGTQLNGGRGLRIVEDGEESVQGAVAQMVELVAAGEDEFCAGLPEGGGELLVVLNPAVDGDAMDAVSFGGAGKAGSGGQGVSNALLNRG
jgi:hypothetical protein